MIRRLVITLLLAPLLLTAMGCALPKPSPVLLPPPAKMPAAIVAIEDFGFALPVADGWLKATTRGNDRLWIGPNRTLGRAEVRLVAGPDYPGTAAELAVAGARLRGVRTPTEPVDATVAGLPAQFVSGHAGVNKRRTVVYAWSADGATTFLLIGTWVDDQDGHDVMAMIGGLKTTASLPDQGAPVANDHADQPKPE
jgi:hypothetical protein